MTAVINETEIKLRIGNLALARQLIEAHAFCIAVPEVFERNLVFDDSCGTLRSSRQLLRLRQAGNLVTLTFKGVATSGKHKVREERETTVGSFGEMLVILERLGLRQTFIYEKYRTEFRADSAGVITLDQTPIGNFLELEGHPDWIDATARLLGFKEEDYLTSSYGSLYLEWCRSTGETPGNMIFPSAGPSAGLGAT